VVERLRTKALGATAVAQEKLTVAAMLALRLWTVFL
jgi:hypothetical protein